MPVGNQPSVASINGTATALALQWRELCQSTLDFDSQLQTLGLAGLENLGGTGQGFQSVDASTMLAGMGNLATLAGLYQDQPLPGGFTLPFNFKANTIPFWAMQ